MRTDEHCLGLAALLPLSAFGSAAPMAQLLAHWRQRAGKQCAQQLQELCTAGSAAVLFTERVHNALPHVAAPLLAILQRDLAACSGCEDKALRRHAKFTHVLLCARAFKDNDGGLARTGAVPVGPRQKVRRF